MEHCTIQYPVLNLGPMARYKARFLIFGYYTELYGPFIRTENARTIRAKILELHFHRRNYEAIPALHDTLLRQIKDFEKICLLHEILQTA